VTLLSGMETHVCYGLSLNGPETKSLPIELVQFYAHFCSHACQHGPLTHLTDDASDPKSPSCQGCLDISFASRPPEDITWCMHASITIGMLHKLVCIAQTQGHIATADFTAQAKARAGQKLNCHQRLMCTCMAMERVVHN